MSSHPLSCSQSLFNFIFTPHFILCKATFELGAMLSCFEVSRSHIIRHTHTQSVGVLWTSDQLAAEAGNYTTHNKHNRHIQAVSGILTRQPDNRAATDLRIWPHGCRRRFLLLARTNVSYHQTTFLLLYTDLSILRVRADLKFPKWITTISWILSNLSGP
jgi:hypothetical protein